MEIRGYRPADEPVLYQICRLTGDSGRDATGRYADPRLLGEVYVGPYLALAPQLALVLDAGDGTPVGYALGALDSAAFAVACEARWWPPLRRRHPDPGSDPADPDQQLISVIHHPPPVPAVAAGYPSHLHIDLLPRAQGGGHGRALVQRLLAALARAGSPGVHVGVDPANERALGFYRRIGFAEAQRGPEVVFLTARLALPAGGAVAQQPVDGGDVAR